MHTFWFEAAFCISDILLRNKVRAFLNHSIGCASLSNIDPKSKSKLYFLIIQLAISTKPTCQSQAGRWREHNAISPSTQINLQTTHKVKNYWHILYCPAFL